MNKSISWFVVMLFSPLWAFSQSSAVSTTECQPVETEDRINRNYMDIDLNHPIHTWEGWDYRKRVAKTDLNQDGNKESVWVLANIDKIPGQKEFLWDDSHRWAIVVQQSEGRETLMFFDRLQFAHLEPKIINSKEGRKVIRFSIPQAERYEENQIVYPTVVYEMMYHGMGKVSACKKEIYKTVRNNH